MVHAALAGLGDTLPFAAADTIGAHNEYLELLLTGGVVGLVAYLTFLATVLYTARQNLAADPQKCGWLFCALAYAVQAAFNNRVSASVSGVSCTARRTDGSAATGNKTLPRSGTGWAAPAGGRCGGGQTTASLSFFVTKTTKF